MSLLCTVPLLQLSLKCICYPLNLAGKSRKGFGNQTQMLHITHYFARTAVASNVKVIYATNVDVITVNL